MDYIDCTTIGIGEKNRVQDGGIVVYPNPVNDPRKINIGSPEMMLQLNVYNALGELVYKTPHNSNQIQLNLQGLGH